jgi:uncharacterized membrane protein (DUF485 family)
MFDFIPLIGFTIKVVAVIVTKAAVVAVAVVVVAVVVVVTRIYCLFWSIDHPPHYFLKIPT